MNEKANERRQLFHGTILYWSVGSLFVLTMLSIWMVSGIFAKYIVIGSSVDTAQVANVGIVKNELKEHKPHEENVNDGFYQLTDEEVDSFAYEKVLPGVDIPKDPFIRLELSGAEVVYELYLTVIESDPFPEEVSYTVRSDLWTPVPGKQGVYRYKDLLGPDFPETMIYILQDNKLYVTEHYKGNGDFSLTFKAQLIQKR